MADRGHVVMEELAEPECRQLLAAHHFGRLAVANDDGPLVLPVNYVYDEGHVVIRTDPGTKLDRSAQGRVAFEIDEIDEPSRIGWSVLVTGAGYDVTDSIDHASVSARGFPVDTWAPGDKAHWIRIEPQSITGRRLRPA